MSGGKREFRNAVLYDLLRTGPVPAFEWSHHAKQRARELAAQGLDLRDIGGLTDGSAAVAWSEKYAAPVLRYRDWAMPLEVSDGALVVAVTVLPSGREVWQKVLASGLVAEGRTEIRI